MLLFFYNTILFTIFATSIALSSDKTIYLTDEDFALAKTLSTVGPNGTIFNPPHNEVKRSNAIEGRNAWKYGIWPNARVPYTLDPNFDNNQRAEVARAFENYHSKTCVRFVAKQSTDNDYVQILRDDNTCGLANICKAGGAQFAKFGGSCINSGTMSHELGHTLCFGHEQTRPDRDSYISWNANKCTPHNKDNANDFTSLDLLYDYVSLQHYEGECYNGCVIPKISGVTKCGSGGDLSVLDAEKINAFYKCGGNKKKKNKEVQSSCVKTAIPSCVTISGCYSYRFRPISLIANDNLVSGGTDSNGDILYPCRGYVNGDIIVGKGNFKSRSCHVGYGGLEYKLTENFEILTNPKNVNINWTKHPANGIVPIKRYTWR